MLRQELGQRQLMEAVRAGVISPDPLTRQVYAFQQEKRVADVVELPFSAAAAPGAPTEAQLMRWYENHKDDYTSAEFRRIKAVLLLPEVVGKEIPVSDDDLKAAYELHRAEYDRPEKRSLQVLLTDDEAKAKDMAAQWLTGPPPSAPVELNDATPDAIPAPELAAAAFAAPMGVVMPPVHSALGWHVFKVTNITQGSNKSLDEVKDALHAAIVADKVADIIYDRAGKIEDMLTGGTTLDDLPTDLGLAAVTGSMDRQGNTLEGEKAPIPGSDALVAALEQDAFAMKKGDPPHLTEGPKEANGSGSGYYAVAVEDITPPAVRPYDEVKDKVLADWTRDAVRHAQEEIAAHILSEVKAGRTLAEAATGLQVKRLPPVGRSAGADGVPTQLIEPLFSLKQGEPTMVETPEGFVVAVLAAIQNPDPSADAAGFGQTRDALAKALGDDMQSVLTLALRNRAKPKVNASMLDSIAAAE